MWGLGALWGKGAALGPSAKLEQQTFTDSQAYLVVHAAVVSDLRWFAEERAEIPQQDTNGPRLVVISLPTWLTPSEWTTQTPEKDKAMEDELAAPANSRIEAMEGKVEAIYGTTSSPLWVTRKDEYLRDAEGATRALPDLMMHSPTLRLLVQNDGFDIVRKRLTDAALPSADYSMVQTAVERVLVVWGLDSDGLPQCGGIIPTNELQYRAVVNIGAEPFWTLSAWHLPPPDSL